MIVEVDGDNPKKDIEKMNIMIPILSPRLFREYKTRLTLDKEGCGYLIGERLISSASVCSNPIALIHAKVLALATHEPEFI